MNTKAGISLKGMVITIIKFAVVIGAMYYLISSGKLSLSDLKLDPAKWYYVGIAATCLVIVVLCSFIRYHILIKTLDIGLPLSDVLRIGFIGAFFNTFMLGSLGGDMIKLAYILKETGKKSESVASVMLDRVIGLTGLISLGCIAMLISWNKVVATPGLHNVALMGFATFGLAGACSATGFVAMTKGRKAGLLLWLCITAAMAVIYFRYFSASELALQPGAEAHALLFGRTLAILAVIAIASLACIGVMPSCLPGRRLEGIFLRRIPFGAKLINFIQKLLVFKDHFLPFVACFLISAFLQGLGLVGMFFLSKALVQDTPPSLEHIFFAGPPAFIANVVPVPGGGLGVGEVALEELLRLCRDNSGHIITGGAALFLSYRFLNISIGLIGLPFYLRGKKEIKEAEAEYMADINNEEK
ncbi:MAG: flippase-like domain-containing protein [Planctomycetes bacterium]|nr:flippase-like domain-containing protein [Planctomycetota bacterium]